MGCVQWPENKILRMEMEINNGITENVMKVMCMGLEMSFSYIAEPSSPGESLLIPCVHLLYAW